jgi:hypothetical protein
MGLLSKIFGGIKKIIKGVGKIIKKGVRKVGGFFKRVFKGIGKFVGKLGPIGMLGMMLLMPQLGAWWSQFGAWAGNLTGPMAGFMKGVHAVGAAVGKAYTSVTEGINTVLGGFAESVGLGDAYAGATEWLSTKIETLQGNLGLHTPQSAAAFKEGLFKEGLQEVSITAIKKGTTAYPGGPGSVPVTQTPSTLTGTTTPTPTPVPGSGAGKPDIGNTYYDPVNEIYIDRATGKGVGVQTGSKSWMDKIKGISNKVQAVKQLASDLGITEEAAAEMLGYGQVADLAIAIDNSVVSANTDWTLNGGAGTSPYGAGNEMYQLAVRQALQSQDPYANFMQQAQMNFIRRERGQ